MTFFEINKNAVSRQELLNLKSNLIKARETALQIQGEASQMNELQIQNRFGLNVSQAAFMNIVDDAVTALTSPSIEVLTKQMGPQGDVAV